MKASEFRKYSTTEKLNDLVSAVLRCRKVSRAINTEYGEVSRIVEVFPAGNISWDSIKSPNFICGLIPGLNKFHSKGMHKGSIIVEQHFMFTSTNRYEGIIFHYHEKNQIWGMTNHPVRDDNFLDMPHNVVYHLDSERKKIVVGIDYCSSGLHGENFLAKLVTKGSMEYALNSVKEGLRSKI